MFALREHKLFARIIPKPAKEISKRSGRNFQAFRQGQYRKLYSAS